MASSPVRCANCGAYNPANAEQCGICDAPLSRRGSQQRNVRQVYDAPPLYDPGDGEDDLMVRGLYSTPVAMMLVGVLCILLSVGIAGGAYMFFDGDEESPVEDEPISDVEETITVASTQDQPSPFPTNTRSAPPIFPTVTPLPPSATPTPTPGPCIQTAGPGDTVYGMALRCGHRDLSIVPIIVENNIGLECDTCLREGQELEIPWPTPTPGGEPTEDPNATEDPGFNTPVSANSSSEAVNEFGTPDTIATFFVEPTLRPGLAWHVVETDQTLITLIQIYGADAKVLSDLNPEIEFLQCDFGQRYGGQGCSVMLFEGQRVRVPAPTGTPTIPPTSSGRETPTPSPSPTFNVPEAFSPEDGAYFGSSSLITLRWTTSGTLAPNEVYLIIVQNLDRNRTFQARTEELFFVLPDEWQPSGDDVSEFEWTIAIATIEGNQITSTRQQTTPRRFEWRGQ